MHFKFQSSMEYLMTYGWAILLVAIVLIAIFSSGIFNSAASAPKTASGACQVYRPYGTGTSELSLEGMCNSALPQYVINEGPSSSGYVEVYGSASNSIHQSQAFTITGWLDERRPVYGCNGSGVGPLGSTSFMMEMSNLYLYTGGCYNLGMFIQGLGFWSGLSFGQNNRWYFFAAEYNGLSNTIPNMILYLGDQNQTTTVPDNLVPSSSYIELDSGFNGSVANLQLYNSTLTPNQINAIRMEGIGGVPISLQNLVAWWPLNGNAQDYSENLNDGQTVSSVSYTSAWSSDYVAP